ncbi:MAG: LLM class F420-dependent oxidoreductase [Acidimicrobiia bacterium]
MTASIGRRRFLVGVQLHQQHTTIEQYRNAWRVADELRVDSIWNWDHFFPLYGGSDGPHFEAYALLAAMAVDTRHARLGSMVTCQSYRNPDLLADMARTIDHLSGGRFVLGLGSGWFDRDYQEYGYEFGTAAGRLRDLEAGIGRIEHRLDELDPPPVGRVPILIGGSGEKVTLRLVAQHAELWNTFGPPEHFAQKSGVLDEWCARLDRDPAEIERTVLISPGEVDEWQDYLQAGAQHLIVQFGPPYDLSPLDALLDAGRV